VYDANEENPDTKLARNVLTYQDFMKAGKAHVPENSEKYVGEPHTTPGHTLATRHHLRRQKVMYATESVQGDMMDEDFATKFVAEGSGEVGDEIGNDKVVKVKTLPPELAPKKEFGDVEKQKGRGFSALFNGKENVDFDFQTFKNYRLQRENGKKNK
jgi:hypothetical protein